MALDNYGEKCFSYLLNYRLLVCSFRGCSGFYYQDGIIKLTILSLSVILAVGISFVTSLAFAEEVITILPGVQDHNRPRFLDVTFYPIERGKELT
jgi:hypothetical protein